MGFFGSLGSLLGVFGSGCFLPGSEGVFGGVGGSIFGLALGALRGVAGLEGGSFGGSEGTLGGAFGSAGFFGETAGPLGALGGSGVGSGCFGSASGGGRPVTLFLFPLGPSSRDPS